MFGLEYVAGLIKIAWQIAFAITTAIPTYFAWKVVPVYFSYLPEAWHTLPYWHIVGLLFLCTVLGEQISKLTPKLISISQNSDNKSTNT